MWCFRGKRFFKPWRPRRRRPMVPPFFPLFRWWRLGCMLPLAMLGIALLAPFGLTSRDHAKEL
jgi:hypothetical protein